MKSIADKITYNNILCGAVVLIVLMQAWLFLQVWLLVRIVMYCIVLYISVWYTLVLKEAKQRHAMKEVKDAIFKGNVAETVYC